MPVHHRPSIVSFALKTLAGAVASAVLVAATANAAGLGKLTVLSSLGQPLRAEIELTAVNADEAGALVAKLFGEEPSLQVKQDLRRFKQLIETGEIPTTKGQPSGKRTLKASLFRKGVEQ